MTTIYGVDPDETWEIDYCLEAIKLRIEVLRDGAPSPPLARDTAPDRAAALGAAERELTEYPAGSGPIFVVGHVPSLKSYELMGSAAENTSRAIGAEKLVHIYKWERDIVRWSVRSHRNLRFRRRDGTESDVPFDTVEDRAGGEARKVVGDRTLEVYVTSGLLGPLARMIADSQRLPDAEKNV